MNYIYIYVEYKLVRRATPKSSHFTGIPSQDSPKFG